jgi:hypothetical protein
MTIQSVMLLKHDRSRDDFSGTNCQNAIGEGDISPVLEANWQAVQSQAITITSSPEHEISPVVALGEGMGI